MADGLGEDEMGYLEFMWVENSHLTHGDLAVMAAQMSARTGAMQVTLLSACNTTEIR